MSLEARLLQGLPNLVAPVEVNADLDLVRVHAIARQRERRNISIACLVGAAAAALILLVGPQVTEFVTSMDIHRPLPPAERDSDEERVEEGLPERPERVEARRHDREAALRSPVVTGLPAGSTWSEASGTAPGQVEMDEDPVERAPGGSGGATSTRTATAGYTGAAVPVGGGTSSCEQATPGAACVRFETQRGERFASISISDTGGGSVYAAVQIDRDGDGRTDGEWTYICNATLRPVPIPTDGRAVVFVEVYRGTCSDGSGAESTPVRGTVTAVFAR